MLVAKEFTFEASHQIDGHFGKCARLHGHSWRLRVECEGPIDLETGVVIDYYNIKEVIQPIIDELDHHHLGYGESRTELGLQRVKSTVYWIPPEFKPTSENLLVLIAEEIGKRNHNYGPRYNLPWCTLILNETCTSEARLSRAEFNRMKGGNPNGETQGHEEGSEEGKEVPQEVKEARQDVELGITNDDIPF